MIFIILKTKEYPCVLRYDTIEEASENIIELRKENDFEILDVLDGVPRYDFNIWTNTGELETDMSDKGRTKTIR